MLCLWLLTPLALGKSAPAEDGEDEETTRLEAHNALAEDEREERAHGEDRPPSMSSAPCMLESEGDSEGGAASSEHDGE